MELRDMSAILKRMRPGGVSVRDTVVLDRLSDHQPTQRDWRATMSGSQRLYGVLNAMEASSRSMGRRREPTMTLAGI